LKLVGRRNPKRTGFRICLRIFIYEKQGKGTRARGSPDGNRFSLNGKENQAADLTGAKRREEKVKMFPIILRLSFFGLDKLLNKSSAIL
jgi:hypothetical protein